MKNIYNQIKFSKSYSKNNNRKVIIINKNNKYLIFIRSVSYQGQTTKNLRNRMMEQFKQLILNLKEQKGLDLINSNQNICDFNNIFHVKGQQNEFCIKIIIISDDIINKTINETKLSEAKEYATQLAQLDHPNIIRHYNDFIIDNFYIIQMEKCYISLEDWVCRNNTIPIQRDQFIKISLQILEASQYIHEKGLVLRDLTLKNIMIDENLSIKITNFGEPIIVDQEFILEQYQKSIQNNSLFYLPPELLDFKKIDIYRSQLHFEKDIWTIGICLYYLAGASFEHIKRYIENQESYQIQEQLDYDINIIIVYILQREIKNTRPSIPYLIQEFKTIQSNDQLKANLDHQNEDQSFKQKQVLEQIIKIQEKAHFEALVEGMRLYGLNKMEEAIDQFEKCKKLNPRNNVAYYYLGKIYYIQQLFKESLQNNEQALEINPNYDFVLYNIGLLYQFQKNYQMAQDYYRKAIQINPNAYFAYYNLGRLYSDQTNFDEAINSFTKVIQIDKLNYCYNNIGIIYQEQKNYEYSILFYKKAVDVSPKRFEAYYNLGLVYAEQNMYEEAVTFYKHSIQLNPKYGDVYYNLGNLNKKKGQDHSALLYYKKASYIYKNDEDAFYELGLSYQQFQKFEKGMIQFQLINKLNPNDYHALSEIKSIKSKI